MKRGRAAREFYARLACANAGLASPEPRLLAAFASVRRERFLGPGPWRAFTGVGYVETPGDHPDLVYRDLPFALDAARVLNNGQPSLHARALAAIAPAVGERVLHVGAGGGYYTALLAELVGSAGHVLGLEIDAALARRARTALRDRRNVRVGTTSGTDGPFAEVDVVYASAGATHPHAPWLEALAPGGRLCFPLTAADDAGAMVLLRRLSPTAFAFRALQRVRFVPCAGARDEALGERLARALAAGELAGARTLRTDPEPDASCLFRADGWWLSSAGARAPDRDG